MQTFKYSAQGVALTEQFEALELAAYQGAADRPGVITIGYGHTGPEVHLGLVWTREQAEQALLHDLAKAEGAVNGGVTVAIDQNQFDALVDFTFNAGVGAFLGSTLLHKLNAGDYSGADEEFSRWVHAGGKTVAGLVRRRAIEAKLFST